MPLPTDSYPLATQDGKQIRLDIIRPIALDSITFLSTVGSAVNTTILTVDGLYELISTSDCIVAFTGIASKTLNKTPALFVPAGVPVKCLPPVGVTSISIIGITLGGTLYIQELVIFAGLANDTTLGNQ